MSTQRLDLADASLREWDAVVLASGEGGIVLDRSAFYPGGGGQPPDHGVLLWGGVQTRIVGARRRRRPAPGARTRATRCRRPARRSAARSRTSGAPR